MIYSRFKADGGYDYFETAERRGISDDLPTPHLVPVGPIGVPSTEAGRPLPADARPTGSGHAPRGQLAPLDRTGLTLGEWSLTGGNTLWIVLAVIGGWFVGRYGRTKR